MHATPTLTLVGHVESPLTDVAAAPRQGDEGAPDAWLEVDPRVVEGQLDLADLLPLAQEHRDDKGLVVAAGATLAIPYAFKQMIDLGFGAGGTKSIAHVDLYFLALFGVASVLAVATAARFYTVSWLGERVTADMRSAIYRHVVVQSPQFFEITRSGEVLSRLTTDTTLIQAVVGTSISMALRNALLFVGGLAMMFVTSVAVAAPRLKEINLFVETVWEDKLAERTA